MADAPGTSSQAERMERYIKRFKTREQDWKLFEFQEKVNPSFRRAQMRYVGGGGSGKHDDPNAVPAVSFTLTVMMIPAGHGAPIHTHDVEEVFFVLEGRPTFLWGENGHIVERQLEKWDMIFNPAHQQRGIRNDTAEVVYIQVMLGKGRPERPSYPDEMLERLKLAEISSGGRG